MLKPTTKITSDWASYVEDLESQLRMYQKPGLESTYHALNFQLNKMSEIIRDAEISLEGNDKIFERFWKIATEVKQIADTVSWLKKEVFDVKVDDQVTEKEARPIMEKLVNRSKK